jgi:hypothetical protein
MTERMLYDRYGWQSDLATFTSTEHRVVRARLTDFVRNASREQIHAWDLSIPWLQRECQELTARDSAARTYTAILEYELPRDFRRPDVIVLEKGVVVVVEIKGRPFVTQAALDQVAAYARDLCAYHAACAGRRVIPVLLTQGADKQIREIDGVRVATPEALDQLLAEMSDPGDPIISPSAFLCADAYAPLPTIVQAARDLFHGRPLPAIKRARAATDPALTRITEIACSAARSKSRHLVLLSGVPGAGKTLVGLQLVHAGWLDALAVPRAGGKPTTPAVYLSGNGPLVEVLQDALSAEGANGKTFVQAIKPYVKHHSRPGRPIPPEHLIVYDEAQRAHDAERVAYVHGSPVHKSEPEHLVEFCERVPDWSVMVALIGTGQAIHAGEEGGIPLWAAALASAAKRREWIVHGAPENTVHFASLGLPYRESSALSLDTEIRYHLTPKLHKFVDTLLGEGDPDECRSLAEELHSGRYRLLVTRNLEEAKAYLRERYEQAPAARYGLLASSKDKWLQAHGVDNSFQTTKRLRVGPWYNADPSDPRSCCQLETVATEFSSQGLELDAALVAWGSDYIRQAGTWSMQFSRGTRGHLRDPQALRRNVYRVLLTRGRDGSVLYIPPLPALDETSLFLTACGMKPLNSAAYAPDS